MHSASRLGCTYREETEVASSELCVEDMELKAQGDQGMRAHRPSDNSHLQWLPVRSGQHLLVPACVLLKFIPWICTPSTTPSREPTNVGFYHSSPWGPVNLLGLLIEYKCMVTNRSMTNFKTAEEKSLRPVWMTEP